MEQVLLVMHTGKGLGFITNYTSIDLIKLGYFNP